MAIDIKEELKSLYGDASKHSTYQSIPDFVSQALGYSEVIDESWRGDRPRLAWLLASRAPLAGERWLDFGANTGFFTLSLAHQFPGTQFTAVEANPNHARFIECVAKYFGMSNVEIVHRAMGLADLPQLPISDCVLHLNVLHHAGHDFDSAMVPEKGRFADYAQRYLELLRNRTNDLVFQLGSNWGGDKRLPFVDMRDDRRKLEMFSGWLHSASWHIKAISYAMHCESGGIRYTDLPEATYNSPEHVNVSRAPALQDVLDALDLNSFPGEFYRRPLFLCRA